MRLLTLAILATLALTANASAEDYRFTVPVRIENMRFAENARVSCGVVTNVSGTVGSHSGQAPIPLVGGAYTGTITVPVTLASGFTRADVQRWACEIVYVWRMPDGTLYNRSPGSLTERNELYTRYTGQAIASVNGSWRGTP